MPIAQDNSEFYGLEFRICGHRFECRQPATMGVEAIMFLSDVYGRSQPVLRYSHGSN